MLATSHTFLTLNLGFSPRTHCQKNNGLRRQVLIFLETTEVVITYMAASLSVKLRLVMGSLPSSLWTSYNIVSPLTTRPYLVYCVLIQRQKYSSNLGHRATLRYKRTLCTLTICANRLSIPSPCLVFPPFTLHLLYKITMIQSRT